MGRRNRRHEEEEHVNHERWLVTYADLITLLMVLFIVMFAISQVDQKKFDQLKDGMAAGFGQTASPFQGGESVMSGSGEQPMPPIQSTPGQAAAPIASVDEVRDRVAEAKTEVSRLEGIRTRIDKALAAHGLERDVKMWIDERGLSVSLVSRHIVFAPNHASLTPRGVKVVDTIAPVLRDVPDRLDIDGHTNQVKVKPKYYPTDWELSSARAVTVLRRLNEQGRLPARRLTAVAFGHTRPLVDPSRPGSQQLNKRVDIVVRSSAPEQTRALFDQITTTAGS